MIPGRAVVADTIGTISYNRLPGEKFHLRRSSAVIYDGQAGFVQAGTERHNGLVDG
jgi:hypothetical protein